MPKLTKHVPYQHKADNKHRAVILAKLCQNATYLRQ